VADTRFEITVKANEDFSNVEVSIGCDMYPVPLAAAICATEHMMTACALQSNAGFDRALELLIEGAKSNKVKMSEGILAQ
jgi:hypothetical protein